jgi:hypothetical protein
MKLAIMTRSMPERSPELSQKNCLMCSSRPGPTSVEKIQAIGGNHSGQPAANCIPSFLFISMRSKQNSTKGDLLLIAFVIKLQITHSLRHNSSPTGQQTYSFPIWIRFPGSFNMMALALSLWMDVLVPAGIGLWMNAPVRESNVYSSHHIQATKFSRWTWGSSGCRKARQPEIDDMQTLTHNRQKPAKLWMVIKRRRVLIVLLLHFVELELEPNGACKDRLWLPKYLERPPLKFDIGNSQRHGSRVISPKGGCYRRQSSRMN